MSRYVLLTLLVLTMAAALSATPGCKNTLENRLEPEAAPAGEPAQAPAVRPTVMDYVDSEAFDALFESALVNQDAAILVRTGLPKPDWGGRLNAWIAAWNAGGNGRTVRGQAPLAAVSGVAINGDTVREFRLLVGGLMDRVEELAKATSAWWSEERVRSRRVALLRPYNLRFHRGEDGNILLVFFHGGHSGHYPVFIRSLTSAAETREQWSRALECSECKLARARHQPAPARLTGLVAAE